MSRNWKIPLEGDPELTTLLTHAPLARTNLLKQSEFNPGTDWANQRSTLTFNQAIAPDGTLTATYIDNNGNAGSTGTNQNNTKAASAIQYTVSLYVKKAEKNWVALYLSDNIESDASHCFFDVANGVVGTLVDGTVFTADDGSITDVGNGWYRCSFTGTTDASTNVNCLLRIADADLDKNLAAGTGQGLYYWGAQLETGAAATPYIPTTTTARTINTRTNLAKYSQTFNIGWSETGNVLTIVGDEAVAPDGTQTADLMVDDSSGGTGSVRLAQGVALELETAYTYSMYVKANGLDWAYLRMSSLTGVDTRASFDLTNGVVGATLGADNIDQGIESAGNGWYRCWIAFTSAVADTSGVMNIEVAEGNADTTVDLDGTSSIFIWGAQMELGTTPTNYIPTTTAPVTVTGYIPRGSLVDDMHQALETVLEDTGNINDLWKRYKQLN